jgi:FCP1-like phosphatase family protein
MLFPVQLSSNQPTSYNYCRIAYYALYFSHDPGPSALIVTMTAPSTCDHSITYGNLCGICGAYIANTTGTLLSTGIRIPDDVAKSENAELNRSLYDLKHLALILDLDQTMIDTAGFPAPSHAAPLIDADHSTEFLSFIVPPETYLVRCRPHIREFLSTIAPHFTMYVSTLSRRAYAEPIIRFLDPSGAYFGQRLMCRDDQASLKIDRKSVAAFFPSDSGMVLVLDDCPLVWQQFNRLMPIEPFHFFNREARPLPIVIPGAEQDCALPRIAEVLLEIHEDYFKHDRGYDVMISLYDIRMRVFSDCYILFADVWPPDQTVRREEMVQRAEHFGATVLVGFTAYCTHVVTLSMQAPAVIEALEYKDIWLVHYCWFDWSCYQYMRLDERDQRFRINPEAPAMTQGQRQRQDPPAERELDSSDIDLSSEDSEEESSSVDLSFLDETDN